MMSPTSRRLIHQDANQPLGPACLRDKRGAWRNCGNQLLPTRATVSCCSNPDRGAFSPLANCGACEHFLREKIIHNTSEICCQNLYIMIVFITIKYAL